MSDEERTDLEILVVSQLYFWGDKYSCVDDPDCSEIWYVAPRLLNALEEHGYVITRKHDAGVVA